MYSRNLIILFIGQSLGMTAAPFMVFLGSIVGSELAPRPEWVTLPLVAMIIGTALSVIPAALFMKSFGRKTGFVFSALMASLAALMAVFSLTDQMFFLFCLASLLLGAHMAFVVQYRFAAAESVAPPQVGRAVALVMVGGIVAAWLGPEVAKTYKDASSLGVYAGSFIGLSVLMALTAFIFIFYQSDSMVGEVILESKRPLIIIIKQPLFIVSSVAASVGFGIMSFIMTATPISMHIIDGHSLDKTALVIQSHITAMYLPSLFVGQLMERFGIRSIMQAGIIAFFVSIAVALMGKEIINYWFALIALGVGWNFLFIGGTTLLTHTYLPEERFGVQAVNDFFVFGFQAVASLASGMLMHAFGWNMIQIISIPLLLLTIVLILLLYDPGKSREFHK